MSKRHAFTLIEMLTVVAIIGMLAGILLPAVMKARERGRQARCKNNLKQFAMSWQIYRDDNQGAYPPWLSSLYPHFITSPEQYVCLSDRAQGEEGAKPKWMIEMFDKEDRFQESFDTKENNAMVARGRNASIQRCSYMYEFCNAPCEWYNGYVEGVRDLDGDGVMSWAEVKARQLEHGDAYHEWPYDPTTFPIIRCFHHRLERKLRLRNPKDKPVDESQRGVTLNIAHAANIFESGVQWELEVLE